MRRTCDKCKASYDDEFRTTICPHETFAANDGSNNFEHHKHSVLCYPMEHKRLVGKHPGLAMPYAVGEHTQYDGINFDPGRFYCRGAAGSAGHCADKPMNVEQCEYCKWVTGQSPYLMKPEDIRTAPYVFPPDCCKSHGRAEGCYEQCDPVQPERPVSLDPHAPWLPWWSVIPAMFVGGLIAWFVR